MATSNANPFQDLIDKEEAALSSLIDSLQKSAALPFWIEDIQKAAQSLTANPATTTDPWVNLSVDAFDQTPGQAGASESSMPLIPAAAETNIVAASMAFVQPFGVW